MADFNDGVDGKLAFRMRKVNPEQFHTLVRMHLSFELDLNTEDNDGITEKARLKKWGLLSFTKKPKSSVNLEKGTEGVTLSEDGISHVTQLIDYLSKEHNIVQEGIFRRTGKLTRQQDLKTAMSQGVSLDLDDGRFSVHDCASVLKGFLAELSEPLLTDLHYPAHCQIAELCSLDAKTNDARLLSSLQLLLLLLPPPNRILLKAILILLNKTASYEHSNKMNSDTLATLFTPHLLCPRKLSPEALHINSQNLSCLVALMIRKGTELFEIPPKLATDIRAYWVEQERKLLSPKKTDLDESVPDTTGTAHTVFSFVDRKLTAKANSTQDTQAALAQLYAHIQAMPESAKKRRLVKQFNKENGQGTPRHVKNCKTKSLGDSIKKHIFQKKILSHKKCVDNNIGCNITRSSSEENILSTKLEDSLLPARMLLSKSNDEFSTENCDTTNNDLLHAKHMSSSIDSFKNETLTSCKIKKKLCNQSTNTREELDEKNMQHDAKQSLGLSLEHSWSTSLQEINVIPSDNNLSDTDKLTRQLDEPPDETMMTPRSRKPVMIVSTSNLCNLVTGNNSCNLRGSNLDMVGTINCASILEESQTYNSMDNMLPHMKDVENKENNELTVLFGR
ncbi:rho gtpase-activating protein 19 [Lasius niger]|uniref:Rho gtpase-activating protein 19 n=1 Tax=Lasius niger TaxID=67767 RepID=A0A0J7KSU0_LASNI|nr:rho gtpase-activating protein 19 [Lasius niger]